MAEERKEEARETTLARKRALLLVGREKKDTAGNDDKNGEKGTWEETTPSDTDARATSVRRQLKVLRKDTLSI